jgi:hypothetical protein
MRSSDFLFRLIKSLSKGDRRNFKLFAQLQDGDKQYIKLFEAIDKQAEYDEERLLQQFEGEKFTNQFSVAKNYLYNYILKTLHIFRRDAKTELNALLHQVQILMGKNLFEQAQKLLRKAKHMADRQERFPEMLGILETERLLLLKRQQAKEFESFIELIQESEKQAVDKIVNLMNYGHLYDRVYRVMKRSLSMREHEQASTIESILQNPLILDAELALSVRAEVKRLEVLTGATRVLNDVEAQRKHYLDLVATYERNEDIRKEKSLAYIGAVSNLGMIEYRLGNKLESIQCLDKLRKIPIESQEEELSVLERYFKFKLGLCVEMGAIDEGKTVIAEFEREYPTHEASITKSIELSIFYVIALFYVSIGEPAKGLDWINRILNEPKTELRTDLQAMARILNLVIHYHLGDWEYLEYGIKSATRFLSNRERLFLYEKTILKYLRQLSLLDPTRSKATILLQFKAEIEKVIEDKFEQQGLSLFNVQKWIASEIEGTSMCYIEREGLGQVHEM